MPPSPLPTPEKWTLFFLNFFSLTEISKFKVGVRQSFGCNFSRIVTASPSLISCNASDDGKSSGICDGPSIFWCSPSAQTFFPLSGSASESFITCRFLMARPCQFDRVSNLAGCRVRSNKTISYSIKYHGRRRHSAQLAGNRSNRFLARSSAPPWILWYFNTGMLKYLQCCWIRAMSLLRRMLAQSNNVRSIWNRMNTPCANERSAAFSRVHIYSV